MASRDHSVFASGKPTGVRDNRRAHPARQPMASSLAYADTDRHRATAQGLVRTSRRIRPRPARARRRPSRWSTPPPQRRIGLHPQGSVGADHLGQAIAPAASGTTRRWAAGVDVALPVVSRGTEVGLRQDVGGEDVADPIGAVMYFTIAGVAGLAGSRKNRSGAGQTHHGGGARPDGSSSDYEAGHRRSLGGRSFSLSSPQALV